MQKVALLIATLFLTTLVWSQAKPKPLPNDPTKLTMDDMRRLAAMSPAEQEAYKKKALQQAEGQLVQKAKAANITIDKTVLPTTQLQPPVKDVKRLATIPAAPPGLTQLLQQTARMEMALQSTMGSSAVQKVEGFVASKSVKEIQSAAIGGWYDNNPQPALLLGLKAARKDPADLVGWNNLAALLNMAGLEQHAVPVLQHCLAQKPDNSMLLNNMGQAYMGLGDLSKAKQYLEKCLAIDDMHPEANHSMALIYVYDNNAEKALQYFEKELQLAQRKSSLAQIVRSGHRNRINLATLRKQKMQMDGTDNRNFFEEINLGKFKLPDPPENSKESPAWKAKYAGLLKSIGAEVLFWNKVSEADPERLKAEGKRYPGVYADLVDELIRDLGNKYIPLLGIIGKNDVHHLTQLQNDYAIQDREFPCPQPPNVPAGNSAALFAAYEQKCCDLKTPLIDNLMTAHNAFVTARIREAQSNYKQYINGLISICQLDPSPGNRRLVYASVAGYFTFLANALNAYLVLDPYQSCHYKMTPQEADEIIASTRNVKLECPSWLKLDVSLKVAKLKMDCDGYNIEADVYELIQVGAEKNFHTGTSTLYVGAGIDGSFKGVASGSISQQFYIVFDQNNQFADLGMRGSASGDVAGGLIGAEFGYDFSLNSGFNAQDEIKSEWIEKYEKALNFVTK